MGSSPGKGKEPSTKESIAADRDAAARKTSENTASRAKAAQQEKYAPARKMMNEISKSMMVDGSNRGSPMVDHKQRARPLSPDETKIEQARLLTLLRSINPVTVVDQICKAVAYFGGIPGAPPPEDGIFPESANTRETGALFIGWLAEIFPDLSSPEVVPKMQAPPKRGRVVGKAAMAPPGEGPNPRNGFGFGQAVSAPAWGLPQSLTLVNTPNPNPTQSSPLQANKQPEAYPPATPAKLQAEEAGGNSSTGKRGRGRPKGSTNKNKLMRNEQITAGPSEPTGHEPDGQTTAMEQPHQSPVLQKEPEKVPQLPEPLVAYTPLGQQDAMKQNLNQGYPENPWYTNNQEPIGEVTTGAGASGISDDLSPEERAVLNAFKNPTTAEPSAVKLPAAPLIPPVKKRKRGPNKPKPVPGAAANNPQDQLQQSQQSAPSGQTTSDQNMHQPVQSMQPMQNNDNAMSMSHEGMGAVSSESIQWTPAAKTNTTTTASNSAQWGSTSQLPTPSSSLPAPAPKRQRVRKPKPPQVPAANDSPSTFGGSPNNFASPSLNTQSPLVVTATPPMAPSTISDSTATSQQSTQSQSIPVTRPPAEGLEAHYERFASAPQQNGRSHTPSQQLRQHQKQHSVPPPPQQTQQSSVPHQQVHMQQQKSQQGSSSGQREELKVVQQPSARSSSTSGLYSQRKNTQSNNNFNQQYSTHQSTAQVYGTRQPSPQMNNSNSYRTSSSHTLSQASPQLTQTDNAYRTSSPHTIPQASPSFTPENHYRSTSTHSLTQASPTYSQAENTYRTPGVQATSSYSRGQPHTQVSHQNHYNQYADPYLDLPALDSLGHSASSSTASLGAYGQGVMGNSSSSRAGGNSSNLYGTSGVSSYDNGTSDLLRGVSRTSVNNNNYGSSAGLGGGYNINTSEQDNKYYRR